MTREVWDVAKPDKRIPSLTALRRGEYDAGEEFSRNAVGRALAEGRRRLGLSQGAFAARLEDCGVRISLRGYAKWETGETVPGAYQLLAAARVLGEEFLSAFAEDCPLNGEGLEKLRAYREDLLASGRYRPEARPGRQPKAEREVLLSRLRPSAGTGNFLDEENFEKIRVPADTVPEGADFAVCVDGRSMEPVYADGQLEGSVMLISTRGRYALRIMADLAERQSEGFVPLKDLARCQEISEKYLESITKLLVKAGLLEGLRGKGGGYRLVKPPEKCTLEEILLLTEDTLAPVSCLEPGASACPRAADCRTLPVWEGLDGLIRDYLRQRTLADLLRKRT